jgi:hypothetical protein
MPLFDTHLLALPCISSQLNFPNGRSTFLTRSTATFSDRQEAHPPREPMRQLVRSWSDITLWIPKMLTYSEQSSQNNQVHTSQIKSQPSCEACKTSNSPCQFRDRERYIAERSRIVTGASAGPSPAHSRRSSLSIEPSAVIPARGNSVDGSGWYWGAQALSDRGRPSPYASSSPSYGLFSFPQPNPEQWPSSPLRGSVRPNYERWVCVCPQ